MAYMSAVRAHVCMGCKIRHRLEVGLCIKLVLFMLVLPGGCVWWLTV